MNKMKILLAALTVALTFTFNNAQARTNETCLNLVITTNYGVSSPYSARNCFGRKFAKAEVVQILNSNGFQLATEGANKVSFWSSDASWVVMYLDANDRVAELLLLNDGPL